MSIKIPEFRTPYNYDSAEVSRKTALVIPEDEECVVQQHHREEADINTIVRRFGLTGELPAPWGAPTFGDFTQATDFHSAQNMVIAAREEFERLPAEIRERFGHDPQQLLAFLDDGNNRAEAIELGLVPRPPEKLRDDPPAKPPAEPPKA